MNGNLNHSYDTARREFFRRGGFGVVGDTYRLWIRGSSDERGVRRSLWYSDASCGGDLWRVRGLVGEAGARRSGDLGFLRGPDRKARDLRWHRGGRDLPRYDGNGPGDDARLRHMEPVFEGSHARRYPDGQRGIRLSWSLGRRDRSGVHAIGHRGHGALHPQGLEFDGQLHGFGIGEFPGDGTELLPARSRESSPR